MRQKLVTFVSIVLIVFVLVFVNRYQHEVDDRQEAEKFAEWEAFQKEMDGGVAEGNLTDSLTEQAPILKFQGEKYLEDRREEEGVVALASGLLYKVIKEGTGKSPGPADVVKVHYTGTLVDGTQFDSSRETEYPVELPVGGVILGWQEALQIMKEGSRWTLYIPHNLGYGERGAGNGKIPPFATLIFDVELVEVI